MKILFTTDFSSNATDAFPHALWWAEKMDAEVLVLHVYQKLRVHSWIEKATDMTSVEEKIAKGESAIFEKEINQLKSLSQQINPKVNVSFLLKETQKTAEGILEMIKESGAGLVVMGTKGETGLAGFIFGSVTTEVAENSPVPVLGVPPEAQQKEVKTIGFPFDFESGELTILEKSLAVARKIGAALDCVHITPDSHEHYTEAFRRYQKGFDNEPNITFSLVETEDVDQGLQVYLETHQWDVIVWHQHEFELSFSFSNAKNTAIEIEIPFLAVSAK